ncbi:MAG: hypothetical protein WCF90_02720 [Methanomicrobiales archaeon]
MMPRIFRPGDIIRCLIWQKGHYRLAQLDKDGKIAEYSVRRACHTGHKIGPLFDRDRVIAERIFDSLIAGIPCEQFYLDIPVPNTAAGVLVQDRKMTHVFFTARLYSTPDHIPLPLDEIFGVTTFELEWAGVVWTDPEKNRVAFAADVRQSITWTSASKPVRLSAV